MDYALTRLNGRGISADVAHQTLAQAEHDPLHVYAGGQLAFGKLLKRAAEGGLAGHYAVQVESADAPKLGCQFANVRSAPVSAAVKQVVA